MHAHAIRVRCSLQSIVATRKACYATGKACLPNSNNLYNSRGSNSSSFSCLQSEIAPFRIVGPGGATQLNIPPGGAEKGEAYLSIVVLPSGVREGPLHQQPGVNYLLWGGL